MLNRQKVFSTNYDLSFTNQIYTYLINLKEEKEPLIDIYCQIYATLTLEDASTNFETLKQLVANHDLVIPSIEKQHIYHYAINYCMRQVKYNVNRNMHIHISISMSVHISININIKIMINTHII